MAKLMKKSLMALMTVGMTAALVALPTVALAEGTDETVVTEAPETDAPETEAPETEAPETDAPVSEEPVTEAPVSEAPVNKEPVVKTGDSSASVVAAIAATVVVAALGMTFVLKKSR